MLTSLLAQGGIILPPCPAVNKKAAWSASFPIEQVARLTGAGGGPVVIGAANFPESQTLGELYRVALNTVGYQASVRTIGNRELYEPALERNEIQIFPEYAATLAEFLNTADNAFSYSINQSAKEALYVPTTEDEKYKAKAFIDMFVQRAAKAVAVMHLNMVVMCVTSLNERARTERCHLPGRTARASCAEGAACGPRPCKLRRGCVAPRLLDEARIAAWEGLPA